MKSMLFAEADSQLPNPAVGVSRTGRTTSTSQTRIENFQGTCEFFQDGCRDLCYPPSLVPVYVGFIIGLHPYMSELLRLAHNILDLALQFWPARTQQDKVDLSLHNFLRAFSPSICRAEGTSSPIPRISSVLFTPFGIQEACF